MIFAALAPDDVSLELFEDERDRVLLLEQGKQRAATLPCLTTA